MTTSRDIFVGREREMAELTVALDDALAGRGRIAMLAGEPGIGKTRTAEELANIANKRGAEVLWGRCPEERDAPPYWPWIQITAAHVARRPAKDLAAELGIGASEIARLVPEIRGKLRRVEPLPAIEDPDSARFRLHQCFLTFLRNAQRGTALVLIFDNLHAADASSLRLLEFIAPEVQELRLLILGTYRDVELSRQHPLTGLLGEIAKGSHFRRIPLREMPREDVSSFIEATSGTAPSTAAVEAVYSHAGGNPFFVGEVVRLLVEEGRLGAESSLGMHRIPEGVREVVGRRLNGLSQPCNRLLAEASIFGREFTLEQLARLRNESNAEAIAEVLEDAAEARIVEAVPLKSGAYRFAHALIQQTLHSEIATAQRARLHARAVETLEELYGARSAAHAEELIPHCVEAELVLGTERLVTYSIAAGDQAIASHAYEVAAAHFQRALDARKAEPPDMQAARCWLGLVRSAQPTVDIERIVSTVRGAIDTCLAVGYVEGVLEAVKYRSGSELATHMADATQRGLEIAEPASDLAARLYAMRALALAFVGDEQAADAAIKRALDIAESRGESTLLVEILGRAIAVDWQLTRWVPMLKNVATLAARGESVDDRRRYAPMHAWAYLALGMPAKALQLMLDARSYGELAADWFIVWACSRFASRSAQAMGDYRRARDYLPEEPATLVQTEALAARAWIEFETGDKDQGRAWMDKFVSLYSSHPALPVYESVSAAWAAARVAEHATGEGSVKTALQAGESAARRVLSGSYSPFLSHAALGVVGWLAVVRRDSSDASSLYESIQPAHGTYLTHGQIAVDRLLGGLATLCGNFDLATSHFHDALAFCRKSGFWPEAAHACHDYAAHLIQHPQRSKTPDRPSVEPGTLVEEGLEIATRLGMRPLAARLHELAQQMPGSDERQRYPDGLSEREVEVLRLVAAGKSNRDIADTLILSVFTVNRHVTNIFAKTGSANRAEAAAYASKRGLLT